MDKPALIDRPHVAALVTLLISTWMVRPVIAQDDPPIPEEAPAVDPFDPGARETADDRWRGLKHLERIQFLSNITTLDQSPTLLPLRQH